MSSLSKPIMAELEEYFNLNEGEISPPSPLDYDNEFSVSFVSGSCHVIEVLSFEEALEEAKEHRGDITPDRLGMYKRLNNSNYYWRWL